MTTPETRPTPPTPHTEASAAPAPEPAPGPARSRGRTWARRLRLGLGMGVLSLPLLSAAVLALLLTLAWGWSAREGSLAQALRLARHWPGLGNLHTTQVQGNLREGGRIGQLAWQQPGLTLRMQDVEFGLDWPRLLHGVLPVPRLSVARIQWQASPTPVASPAPPPEALRLPLQVDLAWQIGALDLPDRSGLALRQLQGHYRYDHDRHRLQLQQLTLAQGRYSGQLDLQAQAPLALSARLQGEVAATLGQRPLTLQAEAELQGRLAGAQAQLDLQARLRERGASGAQPLQLAATVQPWQAQPLRQAQARLQQLDLAPLWPQAPQTRLEGRVDIRPGADTHAGSGLPWQWEVQLRNTLTGPWDRQRLPIEQLQAQLLQQGPLWTLQDLQARIGPAPAGSASSRIQASGQWHADRSARPAWQGQVRLQQVALAQLHTALEGATLSGQVQARPQGPQGVAITADLQPDTPLYRPAQPGQSAPGQLQLQGLWTPERWQFDTLRLQIAGAELQARGSWQTQTRNAEGRWQLQLPGLQVQAEGLIGPDQGQGTLLLEGSDLARAQAWLQRWPLPGALLAAPALQGQAQLQARWQGGWAQNDTQVQARLSGAGLGSPALGTGRLQTLTLALDGSPQQLQARAEGHWQAGAAAGAAWPFDTQAQAHSDGRGGWQGRWLQARLHMPRQILMPASTPTTTPTAPAQRSPSPGTTPSGTTPSGPTTPGPTAQAAPGLQLQLQQPVDWQWQPGAAEGAPSLRWSALDWQLRSHDARAARLRLDAGAWPLQTAQPWRAALEDLPVAWSTLLGLPALQGDLLLRGQAELASLAPLQLQARLERQRGDLAVRADLAGQRPLQAGLRSADVQLQVQGPLATLQLDWASAQAGEVRAQVQARTPAGAEGAQAWSAAVLSGDVQARWPQVGAWSWLAPPGWRAQGSLDARFSLGGTLSQPRWDGQLQADQLALRSAVQGVELGQGRLRARLRDQQMVLESLSLRGAGPQGGELSGEGLLQWQTGDNASSLRGVRAELRLRAQGLRVSQRADRRLAVSGDVRTTLEQGQLRLRGQLRADQALFVLPEDNTPRLGSDVVVLGTPTPARPAAGTAEGGAWLRTPDLAVTLDLGPDFQLQGQGLRTRLAGVLQLASSEATQGLPRLTGEVRTEGGRYRAYGQQLEIERGVLRFAGPYDNPVLDILALRPQLPQRVGVRITGTAQSPRIRLYADPDMPDADKLAWLVLGRSPAGGGAESALLQQAALALLGGNGPGLSGELAQALGLDSIGLSTPSGDNATGAAIVLGKRLSRDFYLAYESSVSGTFGSLFIFYDLSQRLTLRAQAGDLNALDLIYTVRRD